MTFVLLIGIECLLAASLAIGGAGKLASPHRWALVVSRSGLPEPVRHAVVGGLPWTELVLAAVLVSSLAPTAAGAATAVLLAGLAAAEGMILLTGRASECGCYGELHNRPASWSSVASTLLLAVVAAGVTFLTLRGARVPITARWLVSNGHVQRVGVPCGCVSSR